MLEVVVEYVLEIVSVLLVTLIGVGGTYLVAKVGKREELAGIAAAVGQVIEAAQITVGELEQTVVSALKAGGMKLNDHQIATLKAELLGKTKEKLSIPTVALLEAAKVDVAALIVGAGEDWIRELRVY